MKNDFLPIAFTNKGQGDGTGTLPDVALSVLNDFFVGSMDKSADRREPFATQFQSRYGTGREMHDLTQIISCWSETPSHRPTWPTASSVRALSRPMGNCVLEVGERRVEDFLRPGIDFRVKYFGEGKVSRVASYRVLPRLGA